MEILLAIVSFISSLFLVFLLVGLGWYLVWKVFLSRFRFVRELIGGLQEAQQQGRIAPQQQHQNPNKRVKRARLD